ncbi:Sugar lactone lactonase YvrE [Meinhardsimonia xiamenensis]|jgi:sugar lactone lactonase YvrE|uniref:Sugar lactone lactonase YvrE n=1 Tax=Meinhardsimonia xiamenensis TaxID=990712 RepID=A0A1G8YVB6_9RHOB|nr:SMP-30/gluconolactonase/LRE family protein [Meinhardsimonia xiamenensis]PRX37450.1 sugar lactone lactonase YvrE [Meinhardsimonia xiamenensis]SDK06706.1 Sugar lactone lactonase YvrE [Meinhardsimonia xiamenensis]
MNATIFDDRACELGEGPLWHPERGQLFWFDILAGKLLSRADDQPLEWQFDELVSAAGWIDRDRLLIASETALFTFDLETGAREDVAALEADRPGTRSNDGRADPWGGFWIGTMAKAGARGERGAIYRYFRGELRQLFAPVAIPNAICFDAPRECAYFCDTLKGRIMRQKLSPRDGWPKGEPEVFIDLRAEKLNPDGAVVDAEGRVWTAQWGAARVAVYAPDGRFEGAVAIPARHSSCPAFGGEGLSTLFCTSARQDLDAAILAAEPQNGMTFALEGAGRGLPEFKVTP